MSKTTGKTKKEDQVFSAEERAAMRALVKERKANASREEAEKAVLEAIAAMSPESRAIGERLHAIIKQNAPELAPKTWYGMPAYANSEGKVVCFFRGADKFKERYLTLGFQDLAMLDEGTMWPIAFAIVKLTAGDEKRVAELVKKAVG